jgi:hypothetical protein
MSHADELTPNPRDFVFARRGDVYAVYLPDGGTAELDLTDAPGAFDVHWYDPRFGGDLQEGTVGTVTGGAPRSLGLAPDDRDQDWAVLVRRRPGSAPEPTSPVPAFTRETEMLVKLRTPVGTARSRVGDRVTASVISPESDLGGSVEGTVEESSRDAGGRITLRFHTLRREGQTLRLRAGLVGFVNSKGHRGVDDEGRAIRIESGELVSQDSAIILDEGAELTLLATPGP